MEVSVENSEIRLRSIADGLCSAYPLVWLKNNCQCPECASNTSGARKLVIRDLKFHSTPVDYRVSSNNEGDELYVKWDDGHESTYGLQWLSVRKFNGGQQHHLEHQRRVKWTAETFSSILRSFKYDDIIKRDDTLLTWLDSLATYGIAIIKDCGLAENRVKELAERVGFLKRTHYGETFRVEVNTDATNLAYRSSYLQLHTDLPYYEFAPGVILLHCIVQPENAGGESETVDGFYVCELMKDKYPTQYKALSTIPVMWTDRGHDNGYNFHCVHHSPIIREDQQGMIKRIKFSEHQRDSKFPVTLNNVHIWYNAVEKFVKIAYDNQVMSSFKMKPGDILTFDNHRLLHGRKGYEGSRLLIGGYLDWDIVNSRIRVLKSQLSDQISTTS
ncbi:gamma-butyrobetaine dioxygenase-like [Daktulosphaira vitifoliae]|uniref:gamma-butyrobetaine dioxygenase-like n=1 Tax=Daktulosphaira vitifoliae TaxID=58002 RepID=UPI0021A9D0DF|nr:gamma-butyrobetaine dioxygenase-like [Daktulosphaira vitifoliae]